MILKGSQRGNAAQLARHLLNDRDNEHIELHEIRGFMSGDLTGSLQEAEMVAKGTRCTKFLFSLSMSPPALETVPIEVFETSVEMIEQKLGLAGQPRAIVFHEKEGRRHAHVVWSRIDGDTMTAKPLPYFKNRLMDVSRELYLENNWDMPKGMIDRELRNPLNMTRAEWEQAQRTKQDPRLVKAALRACWESSDSAMALKNALEERGCFVARGDRRGFVAVDIRGEVFSLSRAMGVKTRELNGRLGDPQDLPTVATTKAKIASRMTEQLKKYLNEVETSYKTLPPSLELRRQQTAERHRAQRRDMEKNQAQRWAVETAQRTARLPKGIKALWGRVTGKFNQMKLKNELDAWDSLSRDRQEKDKLISSQQLDRQLLQSTIQRHREQRSLLLQDIQSEIAEYVRLGRGEIPEIARFNDAPTAQERSHSKQRLDEGPDFEIT